jgi:hypothetical protein
MLNYLQAMKDTPARSCCQQDLVSNKHAVFLAPFGIPTENENINLLASAYVKQSTKTNVTKQPEKALIYKYVNIFKSVRWPHFALKSFTCVAPLRRKYWLPLLPHDVTSFRPLLPHLHFVVSENKFSLIYFTYIGTLNQLHFTLLFIFTSFRTMPYFSFIIYY